MPSPKLLSLLYTLPPCSFTTAAIRGLTFSPSTGAITGTPIAVAPLTSFTLTAFNNFGSVTGSISIIGKQTRMTWS